MKKRFGLRALTFEYHGMAKSELEAARTIGESAGIKEHRIVHLPDLREAGEIGGFPGYPPTYIPMRNAVFYSLAASYAEEAGAAAVIGGHNKDDARFFRDVSKNFFDDMQRAYWSGSKILSKKETEILRPLRKLTKVEVIREASSLGVPFALTWSCHRDGKSHCWECPGCLVRLAAFEKAGVPDPLYP